LNLKHPHFIRPFAFLLLTFFSLSELSAAVAYAYDPVGNRLTKTEGALVTPYTYDASNRLLLAGPVTYTYDPNGNLLSETDPASGTKLYTHDFENRLSTATIPHPKKDKTKLKAKDTATLTFQYDGFGRRFSRKLTTKNTTTETRFYHDGFDVLFETDGSGTLTRLYVHGGRIDEILSSGSSTYLSDGLGSTRSLTDTTGQTTASYVYDVFGSLRSETGTGENNYLFTGRDLDRDLGIYYYRNRWYDPSVGRFVTKDPIGVRGGINRYIYADNNPVNYTDPYGYLKLPAGVQRGIQIAIGVIGIAVGIINPGPGEIKGAGEAMGEEPTEVSQPVPPEAGEKGQGPNPGNKGKKVKKSKDKKKNKSKESGQQKRSDDQCSVYQEPTTINLLPSGMPTRPSPTGSGAPAEIVFLT